jgi:hypothetical protein
MATPFTYIGVTPYGGSIRNVSVCLSTGGGDSPTVHQNLTPEECEEMARLLLNAAHEARQEELLPDSTSMAPEATARVLNRDMEEVTA